jgi:hypothetical protein
MSQLPAHSVYDCGPITCSFVRKLIQDGKSPTWTLQDSVEDLLWHQPECEP